MSDTIQIPKFDAKATIAPEAVIAPDAPMMDQPKGPNVNSIVPVTPPSTGDFLAAVKETNEKRQVTTPVADKPVEEKPKSDTTPPVFKTESETPEEEMSDEDFSDPLDADLVKAPKLKSIKDLRNQLKVVRTRETQLRTRNEELEAENVRLAAFQEKMDELEQANERVKQLETYEQIFDIHNNPQFQEKYIQGAAAITNEAKGIAQQYKVNPNIVDQALTITNRKDLNDFLKKSGLDEYGVPEIRQYVLHLQALNEERTQLEKSPVEARETLAVMYRENEGKRQKEVSKVLQERSANAWNQIIGYYSRGETAIEAFKDKPGDPEHTERRNTVFNRANGEFSKVMGSLVGLGLKDMPAPIAQTLAARFQLSEWTGEFIAENKVLKEKVKALEEQLKDNDSYSRPAFSSSSRNGDTPADMPNGKDIASHVFNKAVATVNSRPPR